VEAIRTYPLEENYLVHSARDNKLYILNETGYFLLMRMRAGASAPEIAREATEAYATSEETARADIDRILEEWRRIGLMPGAQVPSRLEAKPGSIPPNRLDAVDVVRHYRLPGFRFSVRYRHGAMERLCHPRLSAMETGASGRIDSELAIGSDGALWRVTVDGRETCATPCSNEAKVELMIAVLKGCHPKLEILALIHAAVVERNGKAVLLPAPSRHGKSTLTSALVDAGYGFLSDDMAVLDLHTGRVFPFPLGLSLRAGSWPLVEGMFPELGALPPVSPSDEALKVVVPQGARVVCEPLPLAAVAFPVHGPERPSALRPLSMTELMVQLSAAGFWAPLHEDGAGRLLDLLRAPRRFRLEYSSLEAAVKLVGRI